MDLPPVVDVTQRNTVRVVSSARLRGPVLAPLADTNEDLGNLVELEGATAGRLRAQTRGMTGIHRSELVFGVPNHTFINAAFTYTRPTGNRFNDQTRGAWYCAYTAATALEEVKFHMTRELDNIGRYDTRVDYAELLADFIGPFYDLRGVNPSASYLSPDTVVSYPAGQALARTILAKGGNGVLYHSVRDPNRGECLAAFRPNLVQNVRQGKLWRLAWQGTREPAVTENPETP